jgi:hypothetical protein
VRETAPQPFNQRVEGSSPSRLTSLPSERGSNGTTRPDAAPRHHPLAANDAARAAKPLLEALAVIAALIFASTLRGEQAFVLALGLVWMLLWWDREYVR